MHPILEDKINDLKEQIKTAMEHNKDLCHVFAVLSEANVWIDHEINVGWMVKSFKEVTAVLERFEELGIILKEYKKSDTEPLWYLQGVKSVIRLCPQWDFSAGSACRRIQTGVHTVNYPTYKLVCDEEAEVLKEEEATE